MNTYNGKVKCIEKSPKGGTLLLILDGAFAGETVFQLPPSAEMFEIGREYNTTVWGSLRSRINISVRDEEQNRGQQESDFFEAGQ